MAAAAPGSSVAGGAVMLAWPNAIIEARGWRRRLVALVAGAFGALALAPLNVGPALIVTMVVAVWLLDGCRELDRFPERAKRRTHPLPRSGGGEPPKAVEGAAGASLPMVAAPVRPGSEAAAAPATMLRIVPLPRYAALRRGGFTFSGCALRRAFGAGWWLGFGYFLAGFWWLGSAFLIDPAFAWALPIGVLGVPAMLALFTGFGFVVARLLWRPGATRILALALGLGLSEWARGHLFTGFPWNAFGMGLGGMLLTAQTAALVGLDGLTFLTIALFAAPATLWDRAGAERPNGRWHPTAVAAAVAAAILGYGGLRLAGPPPPDVPGVVVRIMQPGLWPDQSFSPENKDEIVAKYIALSKTDDVANHITLPDVTLLVWPESAFPFILTRDAKSLDAIGEMLPRHTTLATGAAREVDVPARDGEPEHSDYYNAILVIARGGKIVDSYDKIHLVPFGEYLPFGALLSRLGLRNFVPVPGGFEPGTLRHTLTIPGLPPTTPLVCYEAIFPDEVAALTVAQPTRPRALLNVTNDGWFGLTTGPSQHFAQARLRTIEQGLPMIRGAATGISAILDPYGRIRASLPLGGSGILDGSLPQPISPPFFVSYGKPLFFIVWLFTLLFLLLSLRAGRTSCWEGSAMGLIGFPVAFERVCRLKALKPHK